MDMNVKEFAEKLKICSKISLFKNFRLKKPVKTTNLLDYLFFKYVVERETKCHRTKRKQ